MQGFFDQVHYYVCLWRTASCTDLSGFAGMDVQHAELTDHSDWDMAQPPDSWNAPSWQAQRCYQAMLHAGLEYDVVIDTRPDIWLEARTLRLMLPAPGDIYSPRLSRPWPQSDRPGMEDQLFVLHPNSLHTWTQRHHHTYDIAYNHCILWQYCRDHDLRPKQLEWLYTRFLRPNPPTALRRQARENLHLAMLEWGHMTVAERLQHVLAAGIDPSEYGADFHLGKVADQGQPAV